MTTDDAARGRLGWRSGDIRVTRLETKVVRHVRTPAGVRRFDQPIGSVIVPDVRLRAAAILDRSPAYATDNPGADRYVMPDAQTRRNLYGDDFLAVIQSLRGLLPRARVVFDTDDGGPSLDEATAIAHAVDMVVREYPMIANDVAGIHAGMQPDMQGVQAQVDPGSDGAYVRINTGEVRWMGRMIAGSPELGPVMPMVPMDFAEDDETVSTRLRRGVFPGNGPRNDRVDAVTQRVWFGVVVHEMFHVADAHAEAQARLADVDGRLLSTEGWVNTDGPSGVWPTIINNGGPAGGEVAEEFEGFAGGDSQRAAGMMMAVSMPSKYAEQNPAEWYAEMMTGDLLNTYPRDTVDTEWRVRLRRLTKDKTSQRIEWGIPGNLYLEGKAAGIRDSFGPGSVVWEWASGGDAAPETKAVRHVRTPAGVERFDQPLHSVIVRDRPGSVPNADLAERLQKTFGDYQDYLIGEAERAEWAAERSRAHAARPDEELAQYASTPEAIAEAAAYSRRYATESAAKSMQRSASARAQAAEVAAQADQERGNDPLRGLTESALADFQTYAEHQELRATNPKMSSNDPSLERYRTYLHLLELRKMSAWEPVRADLGSVTVTHRVDDGWTPEAMEEAVRAAAPEGITVELVAQDSHHDIFAWEPGEVRGNLMRDGVRVGSFSRIFTTDDDGSPIVQHHQLRVSTPGLGIGVAYAARGIEAARQMGVKMVTVRAGWEAGGIVWAKAGFGFSPAGKDPDRDTPSNPLYRMEHSTDPTVTVWRVLHPAPTPRDMYDADGPVRDLLKGSEWSGQMVLDEAWWRETYGTEVKTVAVPIATQYETFLDYVARYPLGDPEAPDYDVAARVPGVGYNGGGGGSDPADGGNMDTKTRVRHVRTPEGVQRYGKPIGSPITGGSPLGRRESTPDWIDRITGRTTDRGVEAATFDPVPTKTSFGTDADDADTFEKRLGRCYELAGRAAGFGAPDGAMLVHGSIQGFDNPRLDHAWIELPDGSTWEPITRDMVPEVIWRAVYNPQVTVRYTRAETVKRMARFRHWGPWNADNPPAPRDDDLTPD